MALLRINWRPSDRQLRVFAATAAVVAILLGIRFHAASGTWSGLTAWTVAGTCPLVAIVRPALLKPLYLALSVATMPLGYALSYAALLVIYFGAFLPIGLMLRLAGRDVMGRRRDANAQTYWHARERRQSPERYFRLY